MAAFRLRLLASCALLVGLALVQDPGLLTADTKVDLALAPADWLARALHLWDPEGACGQLQNQAYGYLWPMGPFFLLGWLLDVPAWVVQRLWQGLVMSVALVGTARVARALGVRSDLACLLAGFAFALSPRVLTVLGPISIEAWPGALAPWVLLPLIRGSRVGSPRRAAALSGLAVAMVGGVNAAATFAVLPMGIIWLLTRTSGPRRRALMLWWPLCTALGTLWWLVPLFVMGAYSPPFLDFIETASVTTFPTTLFDTLRGTSNWVPYVDVGSRAGNDLLRTAWLAPISGVLLLLGLAGLLDRRTPHRPFLALSLLVGVLMVTAGHRGVVEGWWAAPVAELLDGALAPLRNVHKFDPLVRLPLVLGLAHVVDRAVRARQEADLPRAERFNQGVLAVAAVIAVAVTALPALQGRLQPAGATLGAPDYWRQAADFVGERTTGGTALLVPGSPFAQYVWGDTADEPFQWLASSPWAVRNIIPLTRPGTIRMLDGLERRFAAGEGSEGLTEALRRAGVEHLVVRNDLQRSDDVPDPVLVHQALATSPGLERVAAFGPVLGAEGHLRNGPDRVLVDGGRQARYPAVEVYAVQPAPAPAVSADEPAVVAAGPEDLPDLLDLDVIDSAPVRLAVDAGAEDEARPGRVVLTDGLRARERAFGRVHDADSPVLTPGDVRRTGSPARDYPLEGGDRWATTARLDGASSVSASTSASDAGTIGGSRRGALPYAALDGVVDTVWTSGFVGFSRDERPWWRVDLEEPLAVDTVTITAGADEGRQTLRVVTEHGSSEPVLISPGGTRTVPLPAAADTGEPGEIGWLRVEDAEEDLGGGLALAEVAIPGVSVGRALVLPTLPETWGAPDAVVLRADLDARTGCVEIGFEDRCAAGRGRTSEEGPVLRRVFELTDAEEYAVAVRARPRSGPALDDLVLAGQPTSVRVSSRSLADPRAGAVAAVDGDPTTTWLAATGEDQPELDLSWLGRRSVSGIDLDVDADVAARLPDRVLVRLRQGRRVVEELVDLGRDGRATFPAVRADGLSLRVLTSETVSDLAFDGSERAVPVGIGELTVAGVPFLPLRLPAEVVEHPCGSGPDVRVGTRLLRTALLASPLQLLRGETVPAEACGSGGVALASGTVEVVAARSEAADVASVVLTSETDPGPRPAPVPAGLDVTGPVERTLLPAGNDAVVTMRENANAGWVASQDGDELEPVVLDGWQQGFVVDGAEPVTVRFAPDRIYRLGLVAGGVAVLGLLAVVWLTRRRWSGPPRAALTDRRLPLPAAGAAGVVAGGLVAGAVGSILALGAVALWWVLAKRAPEVAPWVMALPVVVASLAYAVQPWGSAAGWAGEQAWVGYLLVVPVAAVAAAAGDRRSGARRNSRMAGRSTRR
ncbi:alpha-(1-_3)-arabinofuranosyltransferase domain-containing protein [Nocardioides sp. SYSU DS0663]|uniref:alpha-(1->3)-arabinofuranosyltransferase domain-containing protein n=1 Tax=Nocardioides sp. SYSU DS0663 TaxID=3416445 RepID=UPI003F4BA192